MQTETAWLNELRELIDQKHYETLDVLDTLRAAKDKTDARLSAVSGAPAVQVELSWLEKLYDLLARDDEYCDNGHHYNAQDMVEGLLCEAKQCGPSDLYVTPREELRGKDSGW